MLKLTIFIVALAVLNFATAAELAGGWSTTNGAAPGEFNLAKWAIEESGFKLADDDEYRHVTLQVRQVRKQIVSGVNYEFTVDVLAAPKSSGKLYLGKTCTVRCFEQAWTNTKRVESINCNVNEQILGKAPQ